MLGPEKKPFHMGSNSVYAGYSSSAALKLVHKICNMMHAKMKKDKGLQCNWYRLFRKYDRDGSGYLSFDEFRRIVRSDLKIHSSMVDDNEIRVMWNIFDVNGDGAIAVKEFVGFMRRYNKFGRRILEDLMGNAMAKDFGAHAERIWVLMFGNTFISESPEDPSVTEVSLSTIRARLRDSVYSVFGDWLHEHGAALLDPAEPHTNQSTLVFPPVDNAFKPDRNEASEVLSARESASVEPLYSVSIEAIRRGYARFFRAQKHRLGGGGMQQPAHQLSSSASVQSMDSLTWSQSGTVTGPAAGTSASMLSRSMSESRQFSKIGGYSSLESSLSFRMGGAEHGRSEAKFRRAAKLKAELEKRQRFKSLVESTCSSGVPRYQLSREPIEAYSKVGCADSVRTFYHGIRSIREKPVLIKNTIVPPIEQHFIDQIRERSSASQDLWLSTLSKDTFWSDRLYQASTRSHMASLSQSVEGAHATGHPVPREAR